MREGMLHIRDIEGPKKTGSVETRLEAMEQKVFKCQGMVERGLNANHMMITEFTNNHRIDSNDIGKHLSRLYDKIDQLQAQIYDLQNQNCEYEEDAHIEDQRSCPWREEAEEGRAELEEARILTWGSVRFGSRPGTRPWAVEFLQASMAGTLLRYREMQGDYTDMEKRRKNGEGWKKRRG
ncbi:40S ribosomal protein S5-1 [Hordeum vulgare]|nr:40S ribosomal protein S5-1 [Hordeum vulgare]